MTARECLQILREIKDVAFATVDEKGLPHVRIIDVMLVEEEKLYFCTARGKDFYRQLTETHRTEITGLNREYQMVRISGTVNRLTDQKKWIDRIFEANPSMNDIYPGESRYILEPFCMEEGQIEFLILGRARYTGRALRSAGRKYRRKGSRSRTSVSDAANVKRSVRSSAYWKVNHLRSARSTACTADHVMKTVLYRRFKEEVRKDGKRYMDTADREDSFFRGAASGASGDFPPCYCDRDPCGRTGRDPDQRISAGGKADAGGH